MRITKVYTFDAAHRLQHHEGKCRNLHGHTYRVEATVWGPVSSRSGDSSNGMVLDFGELHEWWAPLEHVLDHAALLEDTDPLLDLLSTFAPPLRLTVFNWPPTAERLAEWIRDDLLAWLTIKRTSLGSMSMGATVRVYETPTSWAESL